MLLVVVAVAAAASASAAVPYNQIVALNDLFSSTSGKGWTRSDNWGIGDPCANSWFSVTCRNSGSGDGSGSGSGSGIGVMYVACACGTAVLPP